MFLDSKLLELIGQAFDKLLTAIDDVSYPLYWLVTATTAVIMTGLGCTMYTHLLGVEM